MIQAIRVYSRERGSVELGWGAVGGGAGAVRRNSARGNAALSFQDHRCLWQPSLAL